MVISTVGLMIEDAYVCLLTKTSCNPTVPISQHALRDLLFFGDHPKTSCVTIFTVIQHRPHLYRCHPRGWGAVLKISGRPPPLCSRALDLLQATEDRSKIIVHSTPRPQNLPRSLLSAYYSEVALKHRQHECVVQLSAIFTIHYFILPSSPKLPKNYISTLYIFSLTGLEEYLRFGDKS